MYLFTFTFHLFFGVTHTVCLRQHLVKTLRYRKDGDIIIGGIFPLQILDTFKDHVDMARSKCSGFDIHSYRNAVALIFLTEEINRYPNIFPNISLGFEIYNSCKNILYCVESAFWFMSGSEYPVPNYSCGTHTPIAGMIGEETTDKSVAVATFLGLNRIPQVSYGALDKYSSDRYQFPSLLRTGQSSTDVYDGVIQLLLHFQWTWIVVINHQDSNAVLINKLKNAGICGKFLLTDRLFDMVNEKPIEVLKMLSSKVVLASKFIGLHILIIKAAKLHTIGITWIGLDIWPLSAELYSNPLFNDVLHGSFCLSKVQEYIEGYETFMYNIHPLKDTRDVFARMFWETVHNCRMNIPNSPDVNQNRNSTFCSGKESLRDLNNDKLFLIKFFSDVVSPYGHAVYTAAFAMIRALYDMKVCTPGDGPFVNRSCAQFPHFQSWQLFHYLRNVNVKFEDNDIYFTEEGYMPAVYHIANRQSRKGAPPLYEDIGYYDPKKPVNNRLHINENMIEWNSGLRQAPRSVCSEDCLPSQRKATETGKPVCCFICVPCAEGEITNQSSSIGCLVCPPEEWPNDRKDKCIPRPIDFLSYQEPLGVALTSIITTFSLILLAVFAIFVKFCKTPIVKANNEYLSYLLLVSLLICLLCSLIFIGYPNSTMCRFRHIVFGVSFALSVSCVLAKTIMVVVAFNATKPNSYFRRWVGPQLSYLIVSLCTLVQVVICVVWIIYCSPFPVQDLKSQTGMIIIECNEGSSIAFWCMLGYMGLLASVCFTVAFFSRHLPDAFNEAKFITFSMVIFLTVWLAFIPAYLSTKGKYIVAVEAFAIIASSFGLLTCIFFPKCYIILMKPNKNRKVYLRSK